MVQHDKRKAPRQEHNSVVEIYDSEGQTIALTGRLIDFSKTGACFACTTAMPLNTELRLRIRLLREGRLYIRGRVVWFKKQANVILHGIEFKNVHEVA